jgi:hypothetical protein
MAGTQGVPLTVLAVVLGLIVVLAVLYFAGVFRRDPAKHEFDINIRLGFVLQPAHSRQEPLELDGIEAKPG